MIERLRQVLDGTGYELGSPELLDILWLAQVMNGDAGADTAPPEQSSAGSDAPARQESPLPDRPSAADVPTGPSAARQRTQEESSSDPAEDAGRRHSLFTGPDGDRDSAGGPRARAVHAPGPRALPGLHGLARALRPLRRHRDHRHRTVADIEATVRTSAESGMLDVIERPEQELRHTAVLLVDDSPSMRVWQPLVRDVRRLLERGGVFRSVRLHRFDLRGGRRPGTVPRTESPVTFLLTDGVDEAWRGPAAHRFLKMWERSGPLVVVPPLPRRLWRGTAFDAQPHLLVTQRPFAPAGELGVLDPLDGTPVDHPADAIPVPVVGLSPVPLGTWARLLTRPGAPQLVDTVLVGPDVTSEGRTAVSGANAASSPSADQLLERFRASFSPEAYRLAVRLAAIRPLNAPVMQLVRIATLPASSSGVVAEVLLGGLLQPLDSADAAGRWLPMALGGGSGNTLYDFRPGVRDLLAGGLSTEQTLETVEAVGRILEPHLGRMPDFAALLADPEGGARLSPETTAFAVLVSPVLDRMYGVPALPGGRAEVASRSDSTEDAPHVPPVPSEPLRFAVFGPELAWRGDKPAGTGTARQRAVLATLLLPAGRSVTAAALIDAVWGDDPPRTALQLVQAYVSRIRSVLRPAGFLIDHDNHANCYRLRAERADAALPLDLTSAERLYAEARSAQASGDSAGARRLIGEALDQIKGEPLAGVAGPYAETQRARLEEWRLLLVENKVELDLRLGAHAEVVSELAYLTAAHPLRERLRALQMIALYSSGQQAEALAVYTETHRLLSEELGIDPMPELRDLYERILQYEPSETLLLSQPAPTAVPPEPPALAWPPTDGTGFAVLGPVRVWRDGETRPAGSPQQRALLAALLLRESHTATADELIEDLWGEEPPSQALPAVRTYASRLRKIFDPGLLLSESGGYALRVESRALDLHVAQEMAQGAERLRDDGDIAAASDLLNRTLGIWDGEPLAGVPGPYAEAQRVRIEEWRLQLLESRIDMDLTLGRHTEVVAELTALAAAHPLRERLRELLMLALYRSGRQSEALAVYADTRRLLADELGVDPRPQLVELQRSILQADPELVTSSHVPPTAWPDEPRRPSQLPAPVPDFTGHASLVAELTDRLVSGRSPVLAVSALAGLGGVGKTSLAVHVAHQVRPHFPDGQLYVDLRGSHSQSVDPAAVLGSFLKSLGAPDSAIPGPLEERAALYRATLEGRRVLVLLDNARDAAQVRPLLPGSDGCAVLITGRSRMLDLAGAHLVDLDALSPDEALQLFARIVGEERVAAEREATLEVVEACGLLPLAIRIAASRLAARRTWTVSVIAAKLADERRRLDELQAGDLAVKATFELGYGQLGPAQARAFRLVSLADGPDISLAAAAAVLDLPVEETEDLLESLVGTSLLEADAPGRYRYHSLVRLFARACAERDEQPSEERQKALSRLLDLYLATAARVHAMERPGDRLVEHLESTSHAGLVFLDRSSAVDWLFVEAECVLACARQSTDRLLLRRAVDLLWVTRDLSESGAFSQQYESTAVALWEAAGALGDAHATGRAALVVAEAQLLAGRFDAVEQQATRVLTAAQASGDTQVLRRLSDLRGIVAQYQGRYDDADEHFAHALEGFRSDEDRPGEARVLCNLSRVRLALGDTSRAVALAEQGLAVHDGLGRTLAGANARYALGIALTRAGRYAYARSVLSEALEIFRGSRQRFWEGHTCFRLAEVELADRRLGEAASRAEQALAVLADLGGASRRGNILTVLGRALAALGQTERARTCWRDALALYGDTNSAESQEVRDLLSVVTRPLS